MLEIHAFRKIWEEGCYKNTKTSRQWLIAKEVKSLRKKQLTSGGRRRQLGCTANVPFPILGLLQWNVASLQHCRKQCCKYIFKEYTPRVRKETKLGPEKNRKKNSKKKKYGKKWTYLQKLKLLKRSLHLRSHRWGIHNPPNSSNNCT